MLQRTRRWLFHIAAGASAAAMLAMTGGWCVSYWYADLVDLHGYDTRIFLASLRGQAGVLVNPNVDRSYGSEGWTRTKTVDLPSSVRSLAGECKWHLLGFGFERRPGIVSGVPRKTTTISVVVIPYWFGLLLTAILPALWVIHWRRRRELPEHACVKCGYDLQGTLAAGRTECPECGQAIAAEAKAEA